VRRAAEYVKTRAARMVVSRARRPDMSRFPEMFSRVRRAWEHRREALMKAMLLEPDDYRVVLPTVAGLSDEVCLTLGLLSGALL